MRGCQHCSRAKLLYVKEKTKFSDNLTIYVHKETAFCWPDFIISGERPNSVHGSVAGRVHGCSGPHREESNEAWLM